MVYFFEYSKWQSDIHKSCLGADAWSSKNSLCFTYNQLKLIYFGVHNGQSDKRFSQTCARTLAQRMKKKKNTEERNKKTCVSEPAEFCHSVSLSFFFSLCSSFTRTQSLIHTIHSVISVSPDRK